MKVLQINATYGYASTGLIVKDIGDMLEKNGEEAFFAYQSCIKKPLKGYQVGNKVDWKMHALFCRFIGKQGYFSKKATKNLIKHILTIKPDIVHLHNLHSNYIHVNLLLDFLYKANIATVITLHDCWFFTGKCFHYADIGCERFKQGCGNCPKKNTAPRSLFFDFSSNVLNDKYVYLSKIPKLSIVGCSKWVCNEAKKGILKNFNITQIYNGVDISVFRPYDRNILKEKHGKNSFYILGMANKWLSAENKNLLNSIKRVLNDKLKLVLVGCEREQLEKLKKENKYIIAVGFIKDRIELAHYYSSADVFVNVTHADTLPTVNMESICCGTPVITYDSCGSPELILEGCGKVVKECNINGLITEIFNINKKISSGDLKKSREIFDKNNCYDKYLTLYSSLVEEGK